MVKDTSKFIHFRFMMVHIYLQKLYIQQTYPSISRSMEPFSFGVYDIAVGITIPE